VAAGATWKLLIASAPWAARAGHTSVIDIAGAMYVIGGGDNSKSNNDAWVSTDRGADWTGGCSRALRVLKVLARTIRLLRGAKEVIKGYSIGTYGWFRLL
jgi:hypothetical protein